MNEPLAPPDTGAKAAEAPNAPNAPHAPNAPNATHAQVMPHLLPARWIAAGAVLLTALCAAAVMYAWNTQQRVKGLEQQLVKRQEDSGHQAAEAQMLAQWLTEELKETAGAAPAQA